MISIPSGHPIGMEEDFHNIIFVVIKILYSLLSIVPGSHHYLKYFMSHNTSIMVLLYRKKYMTRMHYQFHMLFDIFINILSTNKLH